LSCFFQDFAGASPYAYDLESLGHHSRSVDRLTAHWQHLPGLSTIEADFDTLLDEPEATARRLLDDLGITWHKSCAKQIDSRRVSWRKRNTDYLHQLGPLKSVLDLKDT